MVMLIKLTIKTLKGVVSYSRCALATGINFNLLWKEIVMKTRYLTILVLILSMGLFIGCDMEKPKISNVSVSSLKVVDGEKIYASFSASDNEQLNYYEVSLTGAIDAKGKLSGRSVLINNITINTLTRPGTHCVTIRVRDAAGNQAVYRTDDIEVTLQPTPKVINLSASPETVKMNESVTFTAITDIPTKEVLLKWYNVTSSMQGSGTNWSVTRTVPLKTDDYLLNYTAFAEGRYGWMSESQTKYVKVIKNQ